jgi:hypothetical protein
MELKMQSSKTLKKINFVKWFETYKPIPNHINKNGTYCGIDNINYSFETYGGEKKFVAKQDQKFVAHDLIVTTPG